MALREVDVQAAREAMLEALEASNWAGRQTTGTTMLDVVEAARALPGADNDESLPNLLLMGYAEALTSGYPAAIGA